MLRLLVVPVLCLGIGTAEAFDTPPSQPYEIDLPFQGEYLVYAAAARSLAGQQVANSITQELGGDWSVSSWNRRSASPHYVVGSGASVASAFAQSSDAESAALSVLERNSGALGVDPAQLRLKDIREGMGKTAVHYQQTYEGLDVVGGRAHATFMNTGRVFVMGADYYKIDGLSVVPRLSQWEAERVALAALPQLDRVVSSQEGEETGLYVLPYPTSFDSYDPRLVWEVTIETDGRTGVFHTYVDAASGEILWRYNDVHYTNYVGAVDGTAEQSTHCNGESLQPMKYMEVSIEEGVGTTFTDANGNWTIQNGDNNLRAASTRFFGPFVDVNRASGGSDPFWSALMTPGVPRTLSWDDHNSRQDERDIFDAVVDMHDFFETFDPGYSYSNARITANVGVAGTCNAFWNGSINFYDAGANCENTGEIQGVVHHEFGHGVQNNLIGGQGDEGLGEGNADVLANFMTDEAIIGRGFFVNNCTSGIRTSNNTKQYPEDLASDEHASGQIIAGVMWDLRENLETALGAPGGKFRAAQVWHFGRKLEEPTTQPDQCLSLFIADDDNGNLLDGTPNFDSICPAVQQHDLDGDAFDCPEAGTVWVDVANNGSEDGTIQHPYNSIFQAQGARPPGYIMKVRDGSYVEVGTLNKRGTIRALGGTVRVGAP